MKSFSVYLEKAKRASSSEYYVDYELLKGSLEAFSRRRAALGTVLNDENDNAFVTVPALGGFKTKNKKENNVFCVMCCCNPCD